MKKLITLLLLAVMVLSLLLTISAQTVAPGVIFSDSDFGITTAQLARGAAETRGLPGFSDNVRAVTLTPGIYTFTLSDIGATSCSDLVIYKVSRQGHTLDFYSSFICNETSGLIVLDTTSISSATFVFDTNGNQQGSITDTGETTPLTPEQRSALSTSLRA